MRRLQSIGSVLLFVIGLGMVVVPLALGMPRKANAGADMMNDFRPIMQPDFAAASTRYYADMSTMGRDFEPIITRPGIERYKSYLGTTQSAAGDFAKLTATIAQLLGMSPAQFQAILGQQAPGLANATGQFTQMSGDLSAALGVMQRDVTIVQNVPAMIDHFDQVVPAMNRNTDNFAQAQSLPMRQLPWMFIVPGLIIMAIAGLQLAAAYRRRAVVSPRPVTPLV